MSEEYITPQGFSSLDFESCELCHMNVYYEEIGEYRGEKFCRKCLDEIRADMIRDERIEHQLLTKIGEKPE